MSYRNILLVLTILRLPDCYLLARVVKFSLSEGMVAEKGRDISISCDYEITTGDGLQTLNILKGEGNKIADCNIYVGRNLSCNKISGVSARYTFTNSQPSLIVSITDLQISDSGDWYCGFLTTTNILYTLQVYSSPTNITLNGSSGPKDLSVELVALTCRTSTCVYPEPENFQWFYKKDNSWLPYQNLTTSPLQSICPGSEKIYSSTLSLPRNTVWPLQPTNTDITVIFQCRLSFPTLQSPLVSSDSNNVQYAVRVTSVFLSDGNRTLSSSDEITVLRGSSKTFTCTTGISRPPASIIWYIGSTKQGSKGSDFTYAAKYEDNNKHLWCKAFNIQNEENAISSNTPSLNVLVKVTFVTLTDGSASPTNNDVIEVTENNLKSLTCTTGEANPAAIFIWYIGNIVKQNGTDKNFSFTPTKWDHDKSIFCKAYNMLPSDVVESFKPKLFVKVLASLPILTNWTSGSPDFYSGEQVTLVCRSTPTRPEVNVRWKKGTELLQDVKNVSSENSEKLFTITSTVTFIPEKGDNNTIISCETYITNQSPQKLTKTITVWWPPKTPYIPTTSFPWLEGQQNKSLICNASDYGNPNSDVTWMYSIGTPASKVLNFPMLTQGYNGENVSCKLINKYTQKMNNEIQSSIVQLNIMYKPNVFIHIGGMEKYSTEINEGGNLTAICSAIGNPKPDVKWQGRTSGKAKLEFADIDRTDNGVYKCYGNATTPSYPKYNFSNWTSLNVTVNYAPNVTIILSESDPVENTHLRIRCVARGRPNTYTYTSMIQTLSGIKIHNTHKQTNGIINIDKLMLQDSGTYTCLVNNGIIDRNHQLNQMAKKNFFVKVSPKVLHVGERKFAGAVGTSVNITIPFYSYPDITSVTFKFDNGSEILNSDKHKTSYSKTLVEYMFYEQKVELDGYDAMLYIMDEDESDFSNYTLVLQNGIGNPTEWIFKHVSESVPSPPESFNFEGLVKGVPTFSFIGAFNGGSDQTFIVETAIHGTGNWIEQLRFNENDIAFQTNERHTYSFNLTGLSPNKYDVRVLAENSRGMIEEIKAVSLEFTILSEDDGPSDDNPTTIIIISVFVAVAVLVAIVISIFFVRRRGSLKKAGSTTALSRQRQDNISDSSDDEVMTENQAYVSADDVVKTKTNMLHGNTYAQPLKGNKDNKQEKGDLYSSVNKTRAEDQGPIYSMPDKKGSKEKMTGKAKDEKSKGDRKGKNKMKKKADHDNVYENASELTTVISKGKETIYENPEESKPSKVTNRNKDGLIYADLTFNEQPKGQKKLVIHGLDSMTEYVKVDFTKRADPLPDSDEETANP